MPISESRSGLSSQTPPRGLYPSRLIAARKRRGLTKKGLAAAIGVSEKSLGFYERGTTQPSASTARGLAEALGFPIEFFYIDEIDEVPVCAVSFRALSKLTARERDQALASAQIALTLSDWLERRFTLPEPSLPRYDDVRPEVAADALRRDWKLGEAPIRNVVHLLEMHQQVLARFDRAVPTPYNCAGHTDGCPRMVAVRGGYCPSCARDAD